MSTKQAGSEAVSLTTFTPDELKKLEEKSTLPRFIFFPAGAFGIAALAVKWPSDHWGWMTFWTFFTSYCLFCWTSCFHETAHQTLCASQRLSIWLGRFLGTMMWVPYTVYRESHIRHHAYLNKPSDWELWPYSDPNTSRTFRRIFVWFDLILGFVMSPYIYGRIYFHPNSPLRDKPDVMRTIRNEYLFMAVWWIVLVSSLCWFGVFGDFVRAWLIPHYIAGIWQSIRKFTEHLGMVSYDPMKGTRTVVGESWLTRLCTYLNFDIFVHGPHHRHPRVAHNELRQKMQEYAIKHPEVEYPMFRTYFAAIRDMLPYMIKDPGVGMNRGAPPPKGEKATVENFVRDVTQEVLNDEDAVVV